MAQHRKKAINSNPLRNDRASGDRSAFSVPVFRFGSLVPRVRGILVNNKLLSMADQALCSGANFLAFFMIARFSGVQESGAFALAMSVVFILLSAHDSLIARPYLVRLLKPRVSAEQHNGDALSLSLIFSGCASSLLLLLTLADFFVRADLSAGGLVPALAIAFPAIMLREFARRYALANLEVTSMIKMDLCQTLLLFGGLVLLYSWEALGAVSVLGLIGLTSGLVAVPFLVLRRTRFAFSRKTFPRTGISNWELGKWLLPGRIARELQGYTTHWISLLIGGLATTGIFAAGLSILAFMNPILNGYFNATSPSAVRAYKKGGSEALKNHVLRDCQLLAVCTGAFSIAMYLGGEWIAGLLYPSVTYSHMQQMLFVLSLSIMAASVSGAATVGLTVAEQAKTDTQTTIAVATLNALLVLVLFNTWGLIGAVWGMLASEVLGCVWRWSRFLKFARNEARPTDSPADTRLDHP